jgi:hypothetical protein
LARCRTSRACTPRPARALWTVRRAPWFLSMTSVVPGQATRSFPIGRTAGTALRHWWMDAARHRPLPPYSSHAAAHAATWLPWCVRKHPHRLVPVFKSRSLLPRASFRVAVARHCHPASNPPLGLRPEPEDPVAASLAPLEPPCAAPWLVQSTPAPESSPQRSPPPAWTRAGEFQVPAVLVADRLFKRPL